MKKLIFILFFGLFACKSGFDFSAKQCVEKKESKTLKQAVDLFEWKIQKQYPNVSKEASYFDFISDWSNKKLPMDFFQDSLELKIRKMDLWTESNRSERDMSLEKKLFNVDSMNPVRVKLSKEFSICLSKSTDLDGIRSFLKANSKYRLSPRLAQSRLNRTNEYDIKKFENRLAIVLGVYYQTMFNIKNTVANTGNRCTSL